MQISVIKQSIVIYVTLPSSTAAMETTLFGVHQQTMRLTVGPRMSAVAQKRSAGIPRCDIVRLSLRTVTRVCFVCLSRPTFGDNLLGEVEPRKSCQLRESDGGE